ncbi:MAG: hydrogenase formation protein HypD [Lachnospiraceae bacterium]|nr:hydrogenase formation protein HypD [Lachnospiraceae bacterium]
MRSGNCTAEETGGSAVNGHASGRNVPDGQNPDARSAKPSVNLMEVCGTHTMSIAKAGIKRILPENIRLLSGPGCPVCVTPADVIDQILKLSSRQDIMITTYGDMFRVPGSARGDNLARRKALGAGVEMVYSPVDAIRIAKENPALQVVFLGIGFETTAPGTAAAILLAKEEKVMNFSVLSLLKTVEPALRALMADPDFNVQGFLCPGHVATIIGEEGFRYLPEEFRMPAVISGFEPEDIILSVRNLMRQIRSGEPRLENEYTRAVAPEGNPNALEIMRKCFEPCDALWRGLGLIPKSGLGIRKEYGEYDAARRFDIIFPEQETETACRCGEVIQGKLDPVKCPLFGTACTPDDPVGPCMVSSEGACAAAFKYGSAE